MVGSWFAFSLAMLVAVASSQSTAGGYAQCGGIGYAGATTCGAGWYCAKLNDYYSQCLPGDATTTAASTTVSATTTTSSPTSTPATGTTSTGTTSTGPSPTASGTGPGSTLLPDYYWIRSVEDPNFHKYLQSEVLRTATDAVMGDYTTAGQFNIVDGQLVQLIDTAGTLLYAHVAEQVDDARTLLLSWETTPDTYGTFAFQGDAVTWTTPTIDRPNTAAWLVCTGQLLYINTGAYDYDTPSGCADETIHYYNGATAVD